MTNKAKKPAKTSTDLDLDLDARLDQATSTLYLDDEPVEGDMLDQVLAKAKKELDEAKTPKKTKKAKEIVAEPVAAEESIELGDGFNLDELGDLADLELENDSVEPAALQSESLKSLENQLASVMDDAPAVSDDEIDALLGGAGYDFDSLLGDANDELTADEAQLNEDSLLAAVDELLNLSLKPEAIIEPEIVEIEPEVAPVIEAEVIEIEAEVEPVVELEIAQNDISDLGFEFEEEGFLKPEVEVKADLIDSYENEIPFEEGMFNETQSEPALQVEPEAALDDLVDSVPFEDTLKIDANDTENDDILVEEFNDFDDVADIAAPLVEISLPNDDELAQQLNGLNDAMENTNEKTAGFDLVGDETVEKEAAISTEKVEEDESDWLKQLDDLDAQQSSEETAPTVSFEKNVDDEPATIDDSTDWMKQLDELDSIESPIEVAEKSPEEVATEDDWMSQLSDNVAEIEETVGTAIEDIVEKTVENEDDWMSQLEGLDDNKTIQDSTETVSDEDDWMKKIDSLDDSTQTAIDDDFNIADEPVARAPEIDESAIIAKAAQFAIEQMKEENDGAISALTEKHDHAFSQLRADQDTLETRTRKQFADAENSRKKTATFSYAALGVGVIALLGSGGLGYMAYTAQNDAKTLKQSVSELEETVNDIVNKAPEKEKEIEKIKTSVDQLNQKVDKLVADQQAAAAVALPAATEGKIAEAGKNGSAMNLLNSKAAVITGKIDTGLEMPKIADAPIAPAVEIAPSPAGEEPKTDTKLADLAKKSAEDAKAKAEKLAAEKATKAKAQETAKAEAALLSEKLAKAAAIAKAAAASTKTDDQRKLLAENSYKGKMTRGMARGVEKESTKTASSKTAQAKKAQVEAKTKEILNTAVKPQKAVSAGKYSVNVVSYQQEWFAQSKAAEFKDKGIPVEVVPVDPNSPATKFRLKVGGFKNKAEADAYAAKVKKTHGIDTWTAAN